MSNSAFVNAALDILVQDDVMGASSTLLHVIADHAPNNGTIAAAIVMDAVAVAVSMAGNHQELGALTQLIRDATIETITRRSLMLSERAESAEQAAAAGVTVH